MAGIDMVHVPYRGGGPAERGLPVDRIYPQLDFKPIKQDDVEVGKENNYPGGYGTAESHRTLSGAA
jgi:hypothetical protein